MPAYVPVEEPDYLSLGSALLYMTETQVAYEQDIKVEKARLTRLRVPLGEILQETAFETLEDTYAAGVSTSTVMENSSAYDIITRPEVTSFSVAYADYTLFSVTPEVEVAVKVRAFDGTGQLVDERVFSSGPVRDERCWGDYCDPIDRAVMLTHLATYRVMKEAVRVMSMGTASQGRDRELDAPKIGSQ